MTSKILTKPFIVRPISDSTNDNRARVLEERKKLPLATPKNEPLEKRKNISYGRQSIA